MTHSSSFFAADASSLQQSSAAGLLTGLPGRSSELVVGQVAGPGEPAVVVVVKEQAAAVAAPVAGPVVELGEAAAQADWVSSVMEGRWFGVAAEKKAVVGGWIEACCFPDVVADPVGVEVLHSVHHACPVVAHLHAAVVFAGQAAQQHWPVGLAGLGAPAVGPAEEQKVAAAAGYSEVVHGASAVEGASVG